ncbi:Ubiquinone biosynthesis protein coq9, mitochondrial [Trapelia coarctata]|nr:Ubiquinone biosynthesis protein coq9, mitochondrial [Trapelia coarctata]
MAASRALAPRFVCLRQPLEATSPRARSRGHTISSQTRTYYSYEHDPTPPFTAAESSILSAALNHIPHHGFTASALTLGARDAGYLEVSTNLVPRGPYDLINYHLVTQRLALGTRIQFPDAKMGVGAKVRALAIQRLRANRAVINRWQEALAIMAQPAYIPPSLAELARLADEIWFLAGDTSVDTSWYTKRATLAAVYSSTELFMTTDKSPEYMETERFLDRRLDETRRVGGVVRDVGQWVGFTGSSVLNVLKSKGVRI